jgi:DNA polymerase-3 subunit gamma/tau
VTSLALYRKYRPQRFEDVLGQEHVTETLQAAIKEDRVGHAYLFSGSRGTGKTTTARILAKALNCESGPTPTPCNTCDACTGVSEGRSLDVIEIDAASHGGVDDVRELRENAVLAPAAGRKKIYIVDEAHMVSTAGWNAFLKTVEEPPAHVVFVFATTEPHKVLATIASRCQRFDFRRVSSQTIAEHLAKIAKDEGIEADEGALQLIARTAEGGVRDAMSMLDQLASSGSITAADAARLVGTAGADVLFEFADTLASSDTGAAVHVLARLVESGQDLRVFARGLLEHLRALLITKYVAEPDALIDANDETRARYASQADAFGAGRLVHLIRLVTDALADMREQTSPRLALELAVVRATMPETDDSAAAAIARIERLERMLDVRDAPVGGPEVAADRAPEPPKPKKAAARKTTVKKREQTEPEAAAPVAPAAGALDVEKIRRACGSRARACMRSWPTRRWARSATVTSRSRRASRSTQTSWRT